MNIDWAVRADGSPAELKTIDFVKVYTALHQQCGTIGETSTEVMGARDLHPEAQAMTGVENNQQSTVCSQKMLRNGQLLILRDNKAYNPLGLLLTK